jgi:hypothetical protein
MIRRVRWKIAVPGLVWLATPGQPGARCDGRFGISPWMVLSAPK